VLQCYTEDKITIGNGKTEYVKITDDKEAITFDGEEMKKILYATKGNEPQPESMFDRCGVNVFKYNNKKYNSYASKHTVGDKGVINDCALYAAALVEEDLSAFNASRKLLAPKKIGKGKELFFDLFNEKKDRYKNLPLQDPEVGEIYSIIPNENIANIFGVNYHYAPVVLKTKTDCITSELNAADKRCGTPYFVMYKGSKGKEGETFIEKFLSKKNTDEYWNPIITSIKGYYKGKDKKKKKGKEEEKNKKKEKGKEEEKYKIKEKDKNKEKIPDQIVLRITSGSDSGIYSIKLYDIDNKNDIGEWQGAGFKDKTCRIPINYTENGETRNNLLIYVGEKDNTAKDKRALNYKYMGRISVPDKIGKKNKVKMKHLEGEKRPYLCCLEKTMSLEVECTVIRSEKTEKGEPLNVSARPFFAGSNK
jgi:hypothetical protein